MNHNSLPLNIEQTLLNNYDIKVGNKFHTMVKGQVLVAERTSGGLKVTSPGSDQVALANQGNM